MRTHNDPLFTSLDTQILFSFILDPSFDETNIINLESKITQETDYETKRTLIGSKTVHLKNYPCIKFLRHLLNTGKIKVEITPTAYSEIKHSRFLKNLILGQLKSGELNPLTLLSAQDISTSCNRNILKHRISSDINTRNQIRYNALDFTHYRPGQTPRSTFQAAIQDIQDELFDKICDSLFNSTLSDEYNDKFLFAIFPQNVDGSNNKLLSDIFELSEQYRLDRKRLIEGSNGQIIDPVQIKLSEVNDCTIMATCALTNIPLITEDFEALATKEHIYKDENKIFNKKHPDRRALGEPFSPQDFIINFFKPEFEEFIKTFRIPTEIVDADPHNFAQETIDNILNTEPVLIGKNKNTESLSEVQICHTNKERYINAHNSILSVNECYYLSPEKFFDTAHSSAIYSQTASSVASQRDLHLSTILTIFHRHFNDFKIAVDELEKTFWGISKRNGESLTFNNKPFNTLRIASKSKEALYKFLVAVNYIFKRDLYGKDIDNLDPELISNLEDSNIEFVLDNNIITGIRFKGIQLSLPSGINPDDLEQAKLDFGYIVEELDPKTSLLLGTNPFVFTRSGMTKVLSKYISDFSRANSMYRNDLNNHPTIEDMREIDIHAHQDDKEFTKHNKQILAFINTPTRLSIRKII